MESNIAKGRKIMGFCLTKMKLVHPRKMSCIIGEILTVTCKGNCYDEESVFV